MTSDPIRLFWAFFLSMAWLAWFCWIVARRIRKAARPQATDPMSAGQPGAPQSPVLIAYASQTGTAHDLALATAAQVRSTGRQVQVCTLSAVDASQWQTVEQALFIVSTTGDGDAPDNAASFLQAMMGARDRRSERNGPVGPPELRQLRYGLLALGDSHYRNFCGFGRALDEWLSRAGAQRVFPRMDVHRAESYALRAWRQALVSWFGPARPQETAQDDHEASAIHRLTLSERLHLNPGSPGAPLFHLKMTPTRSSMDTPPTWQAGDIARIWLDDLPAGTQVGSPSNAATAWREYSLASLPEHGAAEFLIRLQSKPDGQWGRASGWLTQQLPIGSELRLSIRRNPGFHAHDMSQRPMILVGSGSGLAGLRAHLHARLVQWQADAASRVSTWLMFGERSPVHDLHLDLEIQAAVASGMLHRVDRAFSRPADGVDGNYVQDLLHRHREELLDWLHRRGACIYVCGSRRGMGEAVDQALEDLLGTPALQALRESGRYRRDVY